MKQVIFIILIFISAKYFAQYPGAFYAFELISTDCEIVDSLNGDYKLYLDTIAPDLHELICSDNKTWRLYRVDQNLFIANFLQ